ncbi:DNA ligase [Microvirga ossetica]|uniref:DNA ligase (ATP) n=1 Tax=Microvirga ossetica TaxID=1882682 RepID=A0A1B2EHX1_9HYPH|nr:DNA ligase D [Microvirga ossetica]ANY79583.1 DNA ligase [Microvirga ossetica]
MARAKKPATSGKTASRRSAADPARRSAPLKAYAAKRNFAATPEPKGKTVRRQADRFCIQRHDARRLHFDLRLELDGVLKSWAVTRGPSLVSGEKRLAVHTEDHPIEYLTFEGGIPRGEYGGGTMIVWDTGTWTPIGDPHRGYAKGHLEFELAGQRLNGRWHLVRMRAKPRESKEQWLLIKSDDEYAKPKDEPEIVSVELTSILSGKTNGDLAASDEIRSDHAERAKAAGTKPRPVPELARMPKARKGLLRTFIEPSLATLVDEAPHGDEWIHEIKFDGYRLQARIDGKNVKLLTRKGLDWTAKFKPVAAALRDLKLGSALLDGELVVEDKTGLSSFASLQADLKSGRTDRMVFNAFDLLYLDGYDLTKLPLIERKTFLATLLEDAPAGGILRYSSHLEGDGETMIRHACRLGLEGIVSKHRDRPYLASRGMHWQKTKCTQRQEFVIAGYVPSSVSPKAIGSLVLGVYEDKRLVHVGRVGTGFSATLARDLWTDLERLKRPASPFSAALSRDAARGVRWVKPELVAEVEFRGWTTDGILRHASYKGLREDKDPSEIVRETAKSALSRANAPALSSFNLTHPDRMLWPDTGLTKQGLADYYADIAEWILPHVANRPLSLVRCPSGIEGSCFFQKHAWNGMSKAVQHRAIDGEDTLFIDDLEGLIALVQSGVLEIHAWGSSMENPETPDRIVMDLDPAEDVPWTALIDAALEVRERLGNAGLESFVKTTGGKGLHLVAPLRPKAGWDEVKSFAQSLAETMAGDSPDRYVATMSKRARAGKIFVDYLRNGRGATAVAPYSTRARSGAPVSTPLAWSELSASMRPDHFTVANLPTRLAHLKSDPWADLPELDQGLPQRKGRSRKRG